MSACQCTIGKHLVSTDDVFANIGLVNTPTIRGWCYIWQWNVKLFKRLPTAVMNLGSAENVNMWQGTDYYLCRHGHTAARSGATNLLALKVEGELYDSRGTYWPEWSGKCYSLCRQLLAIGLDEIKRISSEHRGNLRRIDGSCAQFLYWWRRLVWFSS